MEWAPLISGGRVQAAAVIRETRAECSSVGGVSAPGGEHVVRAGPPAGPSE
jgi:hypothetical protein